MFKDHVTRVTTIVYLFFHRDGFQPAIRISKRLSRYFPHPCFLPFRKTDPRRVYLIASPFRSFSSKGESVSRIFRRVIDPIFYDLTKYYEIYIYIYLQRSLEKSTNLGKREREKKEESRDEDPRFNIDKESSRTGYYYPIFDENIVGWQVTRVTRGIRNNYWPNIYRVPPWKNRRIEEESRVR